jgi:hypothetical protein
MRCPPDAVLRSIMTVNSNGGWYGGNGGGVAAGVCGSNSDGGSDTSADRRTNGSDRACRKQGCPLLAWQRR